MTLDAALGRNYRAFAQVRLAELVSPTLGANPASRRQALNGVMAKSVDFVICDVLTLDPVAAIEVDDRSHLLPERQQRDAFVNALFLEIGLPLMRVKARRAYSVDELRVIAPAPGSSPCPPEWKERTRENPRRCGPYRWRGRGLCARPGRRAHGLGRPWVWLGDWARACA
jgi:hypothetical protein